MASDPALPSPPSLGELARSRPVALFVDFDGTLVEIASAPDAIKVPTDLAARLEGLHASLDGRLAVVSGRSIEDLENHVDNLRVSLAGSHGVSRRRADGSGLGPTPLALPEEAITALREFAGAHEVTFESKRHGGALHYRARPAAEDMVRAFAAELAERHGLAVKHGKAVAELVQPGADKGAAVRAFMAESPFAGTLPIFIGDDLTDEDGFQAVRGFEGFGIAVGDRPSRHARYRLETVTDVHEWLTL